MDQHILEAVERIATRPAPEYRTIAVRPLTPIIGAEVEGVDASQPLSDAQYEDLHRALLHHHVLVFRDQHPSPEQHKAFARRFGPLRRLSTADYDEGDPELLIIRADAESRFVAGEAWHTDGSAEVEPSMGSLLHIMEIPEVGCGGDTLFANMHLAYEMLSPPLRTLVDGLTAIHDGAIPWMGYEPPEGMKIPKTEHPVVVRHPETGRKLLYVNSGFTSHFVQLAREESKHLLAMLLSMIEREPMLSCRVRWAPNTLVFWDNRCTQHHAVWDYFPYARYGHRVSVAGVRPSA